MSSKNAWALLFVQHEEHEEFLGTWKFPRVPFTMGWMDASESLWEESEDGGAKEEA